MEDLCEVPGVLEKFHDLCEAVGHSVSRQPSMSLRAVYGSKTALRAVRRFQRIRYQLLQPDSSQRKIDGLKRKKKETAEAVSLLIMF